MLAVPTPGVPGGRGHRPTPRAGGTAANAASSRASSAATSASDAGGSFSAKPRPSRQSSRGMRAVAKDAASRSQSRVGAGVPKGSSATGTHAPPVALTPSTHRPPVDPAPRAAAVAAKSSGLEHAPRRSTASTSASETRTRVAVRMLATTSTRRGRLPCLRVCRGARSRAEGGENAENTVLLRRHDANCATAETRARARNPS